MGIRLILTLIAAWVIYIVLRRFVSQQARRPGSGSHSLVDMVRCTHCGTHLPQAEALMQQDKYYCCKEHMEAGQVDKEIN